METINRRIGKVSLVLAVAALVPAVAIAHGDVTPQAVDVSTLKPVGDDWLATNPTAECRSGPHRQLRLQSELRPLPWAGSDLGRHRPDLRYLPVEDEGDEIFLNRIRHGSTRGGRVHMPPFEGILQQEAMGNPRLSGDRA